MVKCAWLSRKTSTYTGNRHRLWPARMVGIYLCLDWRRIGMDAVHAFFAELVGDLSLRKLAYSGVQGRTPLFSKVLAVFVFLFLFCSVGAWPVLGAVDRKILPRSLRGNQRVIQTQHYGQIEATAEEWAAAQQMEAILFEQMIREMRKSLHENDIIPITQGERIYREMLDMEYSRMVGEASTLGIAELVLAQMKGKR